MEKATEEARYERMMAANIKADMLQKENLIEMLQEKLKHSLADKKLGIMENQ